MTTNALPAILPVYQFFGNDGLPLSGGVIVTYLSGTTTPTTTWSVEDKSTANANPIQLDAYGRATIFIDQATVYRFDVKKADLTLIRTMDPVRTPNSVSGAIDLSGAVLAGAIPLVFEGATANAFETSLAITDPTADRTVTIQDRTGTVALTADETFTGTTSFTTVQIADPIDTLTVTDISVTNDVNVGGAVIANDLVSGTAFCGTNINIVNNNAAATYDDSVGAYLKFTGTQVATLALTIPGGSAARNGFIYSVYTQAAVGSSITFISAGATFVGAPSTLAAGSVTRWQYLHATTKWYPA